MLSFNQKTEIVNRLKKGENRNNIALEIWQQCTSTVLDIKKRETAI